MKNYNNAMEETFLKEVSDNLVCSKNTKKFILKELRAIVYSFTQEHNDVNVEKLYEEFGDPKNFATEIVEKEEYKELVKKAKRKAWLWMAFSAIAVVLIIALIFMIAYIIKRLGGHFTVSDVESFDTQMIV